MFFKNNELTIFEPTAPGHFAAVRSLFKEYFDFIYTLPNIQMNSDVHNPAAEIDELETGKYAAPSGAVLVAGFEGGYIGAVALRQLTGEICEMKRLYVRPNGRGISAGYHLAAKIIQKGRELGYEKMRLDTHPVMTKAHALYYALGFYKISKYNQNHDPDALFMELDLKQSDK